MRLQLKSQNQNFEADVANIQGRWNEIVDGNWPKQLGHFDHDIYNGGMFVFDPVTNRYGFQEGSDYDTEDEFMTDLMNEPERNGSVDDLDNESYGDLQVGDGPPESTLMISHTFDLDQESSDDDERKDSPKKKGTVYVKIFACEKFRQWPVLLHQKFRQF